LGKPDRLEKNLNIRVTLIPVSPERGTSNLPSGAPPTKDGTLRRAISGEGASPIFVVE